MQTPMEPKKQCRTCGNYKDSKKDFYKRKASEDGRHYDCKICCKVARSLEAVRKRDKKSKIMVRQMHRAISLGVEYEKNITLAGLYKRAHGICQLCFTYVEPRRASPDHILPFSKGGTHIWDNLQLVHLKCNLRKGNRT